MLKTKKLLIVLLVLVAGATSLVIVNRQQKENSKNDQPQTQDIDQQEAPLNPAKESLIKNEQSSTDTNSTNETDENNQATLNTANIVISDASQYDDEIEVRAFVTNVIEDGICKITFSKGATKFTIEEAAFADASTTVCLTQTVSRSRFSQSGAWHVEVAYTSDSGSATGAVKTEIDIQ